MTEGKTSEDVPEISIVIPCLNESAAIAECVAAAKGWFGRSGTAGEVIVVDNNSTDGTAARASEAGARVISEKEPGKGNAVRAGVAEATGRYIVMSDGDGTYDLSDLGPLIQPLRDGYDMVIGNRMRGKIAAGAMPWHHRYIGNPVLNALITAATRRRYGDCLSGLRAMTRAAWDAMSPQAGGFQLESEMCLQASKLELKVTNVPIAYRRRRDPSKLSSVRHGFAITLFIVRSSPAALAAPIVLALSIGGAIGVAVRRLASRDTA